MVSYSRKSLREFIMKKIVLCFLLFVALNAFAQTESNRLALQQIQEHYNNNEPARIVAMLTPSFQEKVNLATMTQLINSFRQNFGNFTSFEYIDGGERGDVYLGIFENGQQHIAIAVNEEHKVNGLLFKPVENDEPPKFERNSTALQLPFKGEWFTYWGGDTKAQNYHVTTKVQRGAFDFLKLGANNRSYTKSGTRNEDYYAFGEPIYAVCDAEVYDVITGVEDNRPTQMNPAQPLGNSVTLKTANGEYIVYAHFENGTIAVEKGETVKAGSYLGNCGNSGNSSEPHLHLHIQDGPNLMTAAGAKCYFEEVVVNGELKKDYSPVKFDRITRPEK